MVSGADKMDSECSVSVFHSFYEERSCRVPGEATTHKNTCRLSTFVAAMQCIRVRMTTMAIGSELLFSIMYTAVCSHMLLPYGNNINNLNQLLFL